MTIRRSFFIALPAGLAISAAIYFGLFLLQLGVPNEAVRRIHELIRAKQEIAFSVTCPKLLVVAGSSAHTGISATEIERVTGFPAVNLGVNAALGPAYTLHLAAEVCRSGDVVLLAFEYEQLVSENVTGANADTLFLQYVLGYDPDFVRSLSIERQIRIALQTPGRQLMGGVKNLFRSTGSHAPPRSSGAPLLGDMNRNGDSIGALLENRPLVVPSRNAASKLLALGLPDSPSGFAPIREFCEWARAKNITVIATFPTIFHHPSYDLPKAEKAPRQITEFYKSLGVPIIGSARGAMMSEDQMFDTNYHPLRPAAIGHTRRLAALLIPILPRDGRR